VKGFCPREFFVVGFVCWTPGRKHLMVIAVEVPADRIVWAFELHDRCRPV